MADALGRLHSALAGHYTIERELGRGGMATVYLAQDLKHRRRVALKVLKPDLAAALGPERFLREIEIAAGLTHPHIVPLYDSGDAAGLLYYVMPYVEGATLRDRLSRERQLPLAEARAITREVADALSYAHAHGVLHRDIKPENVLLSGGHALVADFGVAKAVSAARDATTLTNIGIALGTPAYMAPEQAAADPEVDYRADLYALGVIAYEMLAGRAPFVAGSNAQILAAQVTQPPQPVNELRPDCPAGLAALVMRCLEKAPAARPQQAEEVVRSLDGWLTPGGTLAARPRPSRAPRRRLLVAALAMACLVILLAAAAGFVPSGTRATLVTLLRRPQATLLAARVLVAPFENETGDTTLDALGAMAADWIGQGLAGVPGVEVVDPRTALATRHVVQRIPWPLRAGDQALAMAQEVGAGTLVSGAFYREGDTLLFQAKVTDVIGKRLVRALAPVAARRAAPSHALGELQRRVAGSLALASDATAGTHVGSFAEPPSLEAYQEVYRGVEAYFRDDRASEFAHLERAARLDTTYTTPLVFLAFARTYNYQYAIADTVVRRAERLSDRLAPAERALLDHVEAMDRGDPVEALRAAMRFTAVMPGSQESPLLLASVALSTRKPQLALDALARIDPDRGMNLVGPFYWLYEAEAARQLGDPHRALAMARAGQRRFPESGSMNRIMAEALARLGRVAEMKQTLATRPSRPAGGDPLLSQARLAKRLWGELRVAGERDAADSLLARYATLLDALREDTTREARFVRGEVLWRAGRLDESRAILASLARGDTGRDRLEDLAQLGMVEARLGDRQAAVRTEQALSATHPRYERGEVKLFQAEIAAALGERERAVALLRQGLALGMGLPFFGGELVGNSDLEPLFSYAPFEELLRPAE